MSDFEEINLDEIQAKIQELMSKQSAGNSKAAALKEQLAEISRQWNILSKENQQLEREMQADASTLRDLEKQADRARRIALVRDEQNRLQKEFEEKAKELDELTKTAKWREFAFDHQIEGGKRLAIAKRGICADKRGLGKTLTSLIWADMVRGKRVLVLAPNDVVPQFEEEIRTWAPARTIFSLRGLPKSQRDLVYPMLNMVEEFIVTLNFEAWRKDKTVIDDLIKAGIDTVIIDEAHRIKAADKITARGVFQIVYRPNFCVKCNDKRTLGPWTQPNGILKDYYPNYLLTCDQCGDQLTSTVQNVLCMTGTPILNKPQELFSLLFLCDKEKFPSQHKFLDDYCYSYGPNRWAFMSGGLARLTKFMSEFFIQRTRDDAGIHIPPPAIKVYELDKDRVKYAKQYEAERLLTQTAGLLLQDGTRKDIFYVLEMILRERQIMTWPAGIIIRDPETKEILCKFDVEESQKMDAALELLTDLCEEGERVIVFSQFLDPLYQMHDRISKAGYSSTLATGQQTDYHKEQVRKDFDLKTAPKGKMGDADGPRFQVCFATYKAFGTGINLNGARHMILLDDEWNPGMEDQAIGRIDRMNSEDQANVHIFRIKNSIDDFMAALLEEKRKIVDGFNESITSETLMSFFKDRM